MPNGRKVTVQGSVWCVLVCDDVVVACRWFTRLWWFAIMCSFRVDVFCAHVPNTHVAEVFGSSWHSDLRCGLDNNSFLATEPRCTFATMWLSAGCEDQERQCWRGGFR